LVHKDANETQIINHLARLNVTYAA
jgi:hypothetical protein